MLREFAPADLAQLLPLLERHFPEEEALLGRRPEAYDRIVRRFYRWDARLVLGVLRWVGRPVYRFFVIEADGRLAATTILTFPPRAGFISTVMVDTPYRRRGFARRLLDAAVAATVRTGRRHVALDVLATNAPAQALYASLGFGRLRTGAFLLRDAPAPSPAPVAEVLPASAAQFHLGDPVATALESTTAAWVLETARGPAAFVAATVSPSVESAHLTSPVLAPEVEEADARALVATAVRWAHAQGRSRVVTEVPDHNVPGRRALEAEGFHEAFRIDTLSRPV
jgi:ribosomal protein S18 acetylase RimI-like enzyme